MRILLSLAFRMAIVVLTLNVGYWIGYSTAGLLGEDKFMAQEWGSAGVVMWGFLGTCVALITLTRSELNAH
tara:strand:+ start:1450 stop:1662 length:213 start_codon:yes stop_codon:yes gene_type:complete